MKEVLRSKTAARGLRDGALTRYGLLLASDRGREAGRIQPDQSTLQKIQSLLENARTASTG